MLINLQMEDLPRNPLLVPDPRWMQLDVPTGLPQAWIVLAAEESGYEEEYERALLAWREQHNYPLYSPWRNEADKVRLAQHEAGHAVTNIQAGYIEGPGVTIDPIVVGCWSRSNGRRGANSIPCRRTGFCDHRNASCPGLGDYDQQAAGKVICDLTPPKNQQGDIRARMGSDLAGPLEEGIFTGVYDWDSAFWDLWAADRGAQLGLQQPPHGQTVSPEQRAEIEELGPLIEQIIVVALAGQSWRPVLRQKSKAWVADRRARAELIGEVAVEMDQALRQEPLRSQVAQVTQALRTVLSLSTIRLQEICNSPSLAAANEGSAGG